MTGDKELTFEDWQDRLNSPEPGPASGDDGGGFIF